MIAFAKPNNLIDFPLPQGKSNEWYTPARYIDAVRLVMGRIDLDPASCEEANMIVRAEKFYDKHDNGLDHPWYGNIYLNPPFGRVKPLKHGQRFGGGKSNFELFTAKLVREYQQGNIAQAIMLATVKSDTRWFRSLWDFTLCFTDHRIMFHRPGLPCEAEMFGTAFVYLGSNERAFTEYFSQFGRIVKAIDTPRQTIIPLSLWEVQ